MSDIDTAPDTARETADVAREADEEAADLRAAERLSSVPEAVPEEDDAPAAGRDTDPGNPAAPAGARRGGVVGVLVETVSWARWTWRQLTSMRVALILLFLLSLAAIPGSLIPQEPASPLRVEEFRQDNPTLAGIYDRLSLFDVFSSPWFAAIYLLLFISLAGCILPRCKQFAQALRRRPPRAPRRLDRLPVHTSWETDAPAEAVLQAAARTLRGRRFRVHAADGSVASEKGYLREAGNLLFHVALFGFLIALAMGSSLGATGGRLLLEGQAFANALTQYDDFSPGRSYDIADLDDFGMELVDFRATFEESGPQQGTPRTFEAEVTYWEGDGEPREETIRVNHPLQVGDSKVFLIGHGFAPEVTVRDASGEIAYQGPASFLPQDANFTSSGVIKVPDGQNPDGTRQQLGFSGLFLPTAKIDPVRGPYSAGPTAEYPALFLTAYEGDLGMDTPQGQNVYQLDDTNLTQFTDEDGNPLSAALLVGETMTLPDGRGSITFDGYRQWATFQVTQHPGNGLALASAIVCITGLVGSLFVQRRRIWVRAVTGKDGRTLVEVAGLAHNEAPRIREEIAAVVTDLLPEAPEKSGESGASGAAEVSVEPEAPEAPEEPEASEKPEEAEEPAEPGDAETLKASEARKAPKGREESGESGKSAE
ncbi:cytochrome c biogenesis protein ResB [Allostreptomyces psammosilenae]|uniref:Cytochrome c biogenesis protein n=1 Tax=Allostreptomyces psammosilenae TaxID=1892865 RepID=A0A852ZTP9_9ACTN|nr:cytochrome c biogenesis protein ResB [Allostreptomyces psammosilenae]NYI05783.1 cytochrome c biogenesis protein [Allostreptomyces psammosilenae]